MSIITCPNNPAQPPCHNSLLRALQDAAREDLWHRFLRAASGPNSTPQGVRDTVLESLRSELSRAHPDLGRWRVLLALLSRPTETIELARQAIEATRKGAA
jgi:hypothetical protein